MLHSEAAFPDDRFPSENIRIAGDAPKEFGLLHGLAVKKGGVKKQERGDSLKFTFCCAVGGAKGEGLKPTLV